MAHTPLKMSIPQTQAELDEAWSRSYSPERNLEAIESLKDQHIKFRIIHLIMRLFFRGIYFPQMNKRAWLKVIAQNRRAILGLSKEAFGRWRNSRRNQDVSQLSSPITEKRAA
jgi:hypothetical protein